MMSITITRCRLNLHDSVYYATREMGTLYETERYIHNYALSYALFNDTIMANVGAGKTLAEVATARHLTVETTTSVSRTGGGEAKLPASLVTRHLRFEKPQDAPAIEIGGIAKSDWQLERRG